MHFIYNGGKRIRARIYWKGDLGKHGVFRQRPWSQVPPRKVRQLPLLRTECLALGLSTQATPPGRVRLPQRARSIRPEVDSGLLPERLGPLGCDAADAAVLQEQR